MLARRLGTLEKHAQPLSLDRESRRLAAKRGLSRSPNAATRTTQAACKTTVKTEPAAGLEATCTVLPCNSATF